MHVSRESAQNVHGPDEKAAALQAAEWARFSLSSTFPRAGCAMTLREPSASHVTKALLMGMPCFSTSTWASSPGSASHLDKFAVILASESDTFEPAMLLMTASLNPLLHTPWTSHPARHVEVAHASFLNKLHLCVTLRPAPPFPGSASHMSSS